MTTNLDIANRALQIMGSRTNMTSLSETSNEAIQCNLCMFQLRDELNRMAPWNCVTKRAVLTYISSIPGTPENPSSGAPLWGLGLPAPPWAYEYQFPVDCLRARAVTPQATTQIGGVPLYPVGTIIGFGSAGWTGPALKFEIAVDQFFGVTSVAINNGGNNYVVGEVITLVQPNYTFIQTGISYTMPVGAPVQILVTSVGGGGNITGASVINQVQGETTAIGGSYYSPTPTTAIAQGSTTGVGTNAAFNLGFGSQAPQRVILTNQELPILTYNAQITDPNVMDHQFQDAWSSVVASRLAFQLSGDKAMANQCIQITNSLIMEARKADGNEGLTINDVTPDFLRARGYGGGPYWDIAGMNFDWGSFYSPY